MIHLWYALIVKYMFISDSEKKDIWKKSSLMKYSIMTHLEQDSMVTEKRLKGGLIGEEIWRSSSAKFVRIWGLQQRYVSEYREELASGKETYTFSLLSGKLEETTGLDVGMGWGSEHGWEINCCLILSVFSHVWYDNMMNIFREVVKF